jgi:hypothetical protein
MQKDDQNAARDVVPPWHSSAGRRTTLAPPHAPPLDTPTMSDILPLNTAYPARQSSIQSSQTTIRPQTQSQFTVAPAPMSGTPSQGPGLRYPSNKKSIYDRNLNRSKNAELSRAAFAFLFIEMIAYAQNGAKDVGDLEQRCAYNSTCTTT